MDPQLSNAIANRMQFEHLASLDRQLREAREVLLWQDDCMKDHTDGACCCNCAHHGIELGHVLTTGDRDGEQVGWTCACPFFEGTVAGWSEHGMCEGWSS